MRILGKTGLVKIELREWPAVVQILRSAGYQYTYYEGKPTPGQAKVLYTPDGQRTSGHVCQEDECAYMDERSLIDLLENAQS